MADKTFGRGKRKDDGEDGEKRDRFWRGAGTGPLLWSLLALPEESGGWRDRRVEGVEAKLGEMFLFAASSITPTLTHPAHTLHPSINPIPSR